MKKKQLANLIMVAIIVVIAAAGVLTVGHIQGWFDKADASQAVISDIRGVVNLQRDGIIFPAENDMVLRSGDQLTCNSGATAIIRIGDDYLVISDKADLKIDDPSADHFYSEVNGGEVFIRTVKTMIFTFEGHELSVTNAVASLSVRAGAQSVNVYEGTVENATAGQTLNYLSGETSVQELSINSLDSFLISQIRTANKTTTLCFTNAELDKLLADRNQALQDILNNAKPSEEATSGEAESSTTEAPTTEAPATETPTTETPTELYSCTITIRCDSILNNWNKLTPGKVEFVPDDGIILYPVTVAFDESETVFDVLKRVCDLLGIQLEYSYTPLYESYYIEGINHLYEFDCGEQSGWMYKVNGWFPNYGCSSYHLEDGDVIEWIYTCNDLGADIGGDVQ